MQKCNLFFLELSLSNAVGVEKDAIDGAALVKHIAKTFEKQIFAQDQKFVIDYESFRFIATVKELDVFDLQSLLKYSDANADENAAQEEPLVDQTMGQLLGISHIYLISNKELKIDNVPLRYVVIHVNIDRPKRTVTVKKINFQDLGIGGLDDQLNQVFRRAFASRMLPIDLVKKLDIKHVKGYAE